MHGRVLIDFHGYAKHHLGLHRLTKPSANGVADEGAYIKPLTAEEQLANRTAMHERKDELIFVSPMLSGFAMSDKLWRTSLPTDTARTVQC